MTLLTKDAAQYFSVIESISQAAGSSDELCSFLQTAVASLTVHCGADQVAVAMETWDGQHLFAVDGVPGDRRQKRWLLRRCGTLSQGAKQPEVSLLGVDEWARPGREALRAAGLRSGILASLPCGDAGRGVLLLGFGQDRLISDCDLRFVRATALLIAGGVVRIERLSDPLVQQLERAKQEWEVTVDALPQVICVLDAQGRVLRANGALEAWGLGSPGDLIGRHAGCVLHPACGDSGCDHRRAYDAFWAADADSTLSWETACPGLGREVRLELRRLSARDAKEESRAVLVIEDVTDRRRAERALAASRKVLEEQVQERTERLTEANVRLQQEIRNHQRDKAALVVANRERRRLSRRLLDAQEEERRRIARELHDGIGQHLTAIKLSLEASLLQRRQSSAFEALQTDLAATLKMVQETIEESRRVALDLRPSMLDDLGLIPTLEWLCREYHGVNGARAARTHFDVDEECLNDPLRVAVFRVCQEALNNTAKHANASHVDVALVEADGELVLRVSDDGVGLPDAVHRRLSRGGLGLSGMRERAELTGGRMEIESLSGRGVTVTVTWPLHEIASLRGILPPRPLPRRGRIAFPSRMTHDHETVRPLAKGT